MRKKLVSVIAMSALGLLGLPSTVAHASIPRYTRDLLTPNDYEQREHSQRAVWNPTTGDWAVDGGLESLHFGIKGDLPAVHNDGDGEALEGVFRPSNGTWYLANFDGDIGTRIHWGTRGDIPVQAHYRGIDKDTVVAVFRPSNGTWFASG